MSSPQSYTFGNFRLVPEATNRSTRSCISGGNASTCFAISCLTSICRVPLSSRIHSREVPNTSSKTLTRCSESDPAGPSTKSGTPTTIRWPGSVLANCRDRRATRGIPMDGWRADTSQMPTYGPRRRLARRWVGRFPLMWITSGYAVIQEEPAENHRPEMSSGANGLIDCLLAGRIYRQ
jgi:hypothetical protein